MKNDVLVVVDCQNDFIDGSLRNKEAIAKIDNIVKKINEFDGSYIIVTQDTHYAERAISNNEISYENTLEGRKLPISHCIRNTFGWDINPKIQDALNKRDNVDYIEKFTFGSYHDLIVAYDNIFMDNGTIDKITFVGFCTDICVVSNVLITKSVLPNHIIEVDAACCAGSTVQKHEAALDVMESCHIDVINRV
jgi:nicotinamidase-related amidase